MASSARPTISDAIDPRRTVDFESGVDTICRASSDGIPDAATTVDFAGVVLAMDVDEAPSVTPLTASTFLDLVHPDDVDRMRTVLRELAEDPGRSVRIDFRAWHNGGSWRWMSGDIRRMSLDGTQDVILFDRVDITNDKRAELALASQNRILERVIAGDPVTEILDAICGLIEELDETCVCTILLLDSETQTLSHAASRGSTPEFIEETTEVAVAEGVGSCGTAAY
ncbi:MAG TPA: PAS domain-containing protein, partial [Thermomicrobiales bacterium]|nr:PAS domain-containing protein [Thermomicrobiales bacterium]